MQPNTFIINNAIQSLKSTENNMTIQQEVTQQRTIAKDLLNTREAAQAYVNKLIDKLPEMVGGEVRIPYIDSRGKEASKYESKNDILWLIALQTTFENGYATKAGIASLFQSWCKENTNKEWAHESALNVASGYVEAMKLLAVIKKFKSVREIQTHDEGKLVWAARMVNECTKQTLIERDMFLAQLRDNSEMKCKPMNNQPVDWTSSTKGIGEDANISLVKGQSNKQPQIVLDAVNKLQAVKFTVAPVIAHAAKVMLNNASMFEVTAEDKRVYEEIINIRKGSFFFSVTMDTRGRMYYRGGLLTPQGTDICKAAFQFAEFKELGATGWNAILMHTANVLGFDKVSITKRLEIVTAFIEDGTIGSIKTFRDILTQFPKADTFQAVVACVEINRILQTGATTSNLVCHQDGTCNGLQHMAAITGNRETAISVNCVASTVNDVPKDIYGIIATEAGEITQGLVQQTINATGRGGAKNSVMITSYGASEDTCIDNIGKKMDKALAQDVGKAYNQAISNKTGAVRDFTATIKSLVKTAINDGIKEINWTTADGFKATTEYNDMEARRVRAGAFNCVNSKETPFDDIKTIGAMAPNLIHSIDATHLRMVINNCDFGLVTVHDSIGSHPCDFQETALQIRKQFVAVHQYDALSNLCDNLKTDEFDRPEFLGDYDVNEALEATYIFS